jgi:hypothetical protein
MPTTATIVFDDGFAISDIPVLGFSQDGPDKPTEMGTVELTLPTGTTASVRLWRASASGETLQQIIVTFPNGGKMRFLEAAVLGMSRKGMDSESLKFEYWGRQARPAPASTGAAASRK